MSSVPVNAKVQFADGKAGEVVTVIVNPLNRKVTHAVVRESDKKEPTARLVPVEQVERVDHATVLLRCTTADFEHLEPFNTRQVRQVSYTRYQGEAYDATGQIIGPSPRESYYVTDEVERIPEGELAVGTGTKVQASDGEAGHVAGLVVDPGTREVTHFTLERDGKNITLPLTTIEFVAEDVVHLKLDKKALDLLPAVPVTPRRGSWSGVDNEMVGMVFDDVNGAEKAMEFVQQLHGTGTIQIRNAAVLVRELDGKTSVKERHDLDARSGAVGGVVLGGILGLLAGPLGLAAGAALGAGAGAVTGRIVDRGFDDSFLKSLAERLQPGRSGILLIVQTEWAKPVQEALAGRGGFIFQQQLTDRLVSDLLGDQKPTE
jgi:uncharacterized membrane protein